MSKIIFYFSGTGNSYAVSALIAEKIGGAILASILNTNNYKIENYYVVGFVFPVYYTHAPEVVIRALSNIKLHSIQQVFLVAVYGGSWGYALQDARKALGKNKVNLQEYKVRMPANYILEYGALPACCQRHIFLKAEKSIREIITQIVENSMTEHIKPNFLARLAKGNAEKQKNLFGKLGSKFYSLKQCSLCGQCVKICPVDNIAIRDNKVIWGSQCEQCMACIQWCPQNAIAHPMLKKRRKRYTHPNVSARHLGG